MAFITLGVPDNKLDFYKQIFAEFKDVSLEQDNNDIFNETMIEMLNMRTQSPIENSLSLDQVREKIRSKYQKYGL